MILGSKKIVMVFTQDGDLLKMLEYRTQKIALGNYRILKKHGMHNEHGELIPNCKFELL